MDHEPPPAANDTAPDDPPADGTRADDPPADDPPADDPPTDDTAGAADHAADGAADEAPTPVVALLRTLAEERATGTVRVLPGGGWVALRGGRVAMAGSPRSPTYEEVLSGAAPPGTGAEITAFARRRIRRETTFDAAVDVLADDSGDADFHPGDIPPDPAGSPGFTVSEFIAESARRDALLRRIGDVLTPEDILARAPAGNWRKRRVSSAQWRLVAEVDEATPAARIAVRIGHGVTATTVLAHALIRLGVLAPPRRAPSAGWSPVFLSGVEASPADH